MILGVDTDVLVSWIMAGSPRHAAVRQFVEREVREEGGFLGITPQVLHEFLHVVTDPRRFENPLLMPLALRVAQVLWDAEQTVQILPT
ncbi:MAG TPA: PIN domain-containing protein, partial [Thermoanaerobaculia bacterium]|nr:PIN domain-containing protein [Thermoanaerobaculia bacterium]